MKNSAAGSIARSDANQLPDGASASACGLGAPGVEPSEAIIENWRRFGGLVWTARVLLVAVLARVPGVSGRLRGRRYRRCC
jgi:hypothetical protein